MDLDAILESISCPITKQAMVDPVQGNDGQTYERKAIMEWLKNHNTSPIIPNCIMNIDDLRVNAPIRFLVDKYHSGAFGDISQHRNNTPPTIISTDNIQIKSSSSIINNNKVLLSFEVDDNSIPENLKNTTLPQDLILIVDRSGSMATNVEAKDQNGNNLEDGLSQLDLVCYACRTIAATLKKTDRLALITFDSYITINSGFKEMTERNYSEISSLINNIKPGYTTNIWQAITSGLDLLNQREDKSRNGHIIILTDGVPNVGRPSMGEVQELANLRKKTNFSSSINTVGFGYDLEKDLLYLMSQITNGVTCHIPDGGMIATVFNNLGGNILCTVAMNLQIKIKLLNSLTFQDNPIDGDYNFGMNSNLDEIEIDMGTIQMEQARNIILNINNSENREINDSILYSYSYKIGGVSTKVDFKSVKNDEFCKISFKSQECRLMFVRKLREAIKAKNDELKGKKINKSSKQIYQEMVDYFENMDVMDPLSTDFYDTLTDQVRLALSIDDCHITLFKNRMVSYFEKWGYYYLDQLSSHLNNEKRPNFKDAACRSFGGKIFEEVVDYASDKFNSLPPPIPSNINLKRDRISGYCGIPPPLTPQQTSAYNNSAGPCFDGNCMITLHNSQTIKVNQLKKGDKVLTLEDHNNLNHTKIATVRCILKTLIKGELANLVNIFGLIITPRHPIFTMNGWTFPNRCASPKMMKCEAIYSILLDTGHVVFINDIACICLGHGFKNSILEHNYLGTSAVINDLREMDGWNEGLIVTTSGCADIDENGHLCKINQIY